MLKATFAGETEATNELIDDGLMVQPLTSLEIEALKDSGAHASVGSLDRSRCALLNEATGHY